MHANESLFTNVDRQEQLAVEGGIVALEYLFLATIVGLAMVVGLTAVSASAGSTASTTRTLAAKR